MKKEKSFLCAKKNSQYGASALEVIFAIGLVVAVTPFLYNQISEMTHVIQDITAAKKITARRDNVLNYVRAHQEDISDGSTEISDDVLAMIAPNAVNGMFFQTSVGHTNIKIIETYLLFRINDTKYRTSSVAKYIGGDAAIVSEDYRAYAKDWIVELPSSWIISMNQGNNYLVYRIVRDFGGDDKNRFLHRSSFGDNLNRMQRVLHMNYNNIINVDDFMAKGILSINELHTKAIEATSVIASKIQFLSGAVITGGDLNFENLNISTGMYGFEHQRIETTNLYGKDADTDVDQLVTNNVLVTDEVHLNGLNANEGEVYIQNLSIPGDLRVPSLTAGYIKMDGNNIQVIVSSESSGVSLNLGSWSYTIPGSVSSYSLANGGASLRRVCVGGYYSKKDETCSGIALEDLSLLIPNESLFGLENTSGIVLSFDWLDGPPSGVDPGTGTGTGHEHTVD